MLTVVWQKVCTLSTKTLPQRGKPTIRPQPAVMVIVVDKEEMGEAVVVDKVEVLQLEDALDQPEDLEVHHLVPEVDPGEDLQAVVEVDPTVDPHPPSTVHMLLQEADLSVDPTEDPSARFPPPAVVTVLLDLVPAVTLVATRGLPGNWLKILVIPSSQLKLPKIWCINNLQQNQRRSAI